MIGETLARLSWDEGVPAEEVTVTSPRTGGFVTVPGPDTLRARPVLSQLSGPGPAAARAIRGDGQPLSLAVLAGGVVPLPSAPMAVAGRADGGLWALYDDRVTHHGPDGVELKTIASTGISLVGADRDGAWLVTSAEVIRYDASGAERARADWPMNTRAVGTADGVCGLTPGSARLLRCVSNDGSLEERPASDAQPFEELLAVTGDGLLTLDGATIRQYTSSGARELTLQSAGLTADGRPFVAGREGGELVLWVDGDAPRALPLPDDAPAALRVVSVDGDGALAWGRDVALRYDGSSLVETLTVDNDAHAATVYPVAWTMDGRNGVSATGDGLVVSATGPDGLVMFRLDWPG